MYTENALTRQTTALFRFPSYIFLPGGVMARVDTVRSEVQRLLHAAPFRPFALTLENGDRVIIEHPENIAFNPASQEGPGGSEDFYVLAKKLRLFSTFDAVTSVALLDRGELAE